MIFESLFEHGNHDVICAIIKYISVKNLSLFEMGYLISVSSVTFALVKINSKSVSRL